MWTADTTVLKMSANLLTSHEGFPELLIRELVVGNSSPSNLLLYISLGAGEN